MPSKNRPRSAAEAVPTVVDALSQSFLNTRTRRPKTQPDRVYRRSTNLLFRLLVAELACQQGRLPQSLFPDAAGDDLSAQLDRLFGSIDRIVGSRQPGKTTTGLFSAGELSGADRFEPAVISMALDLARSLAAESSCAQQTISSVYEKLLGRRPEIDPYDRFSLRQDASYRKATGAFYTPPEVVRAIVEATLDPVLATLSTHATTIPRILDPSMGTGTFLVEAAEYMVERLPWLEPALVTERSLFGVDRDSLAVELAILSLWIETGARPAVLSRRLRHGNLLADRSLLNSDERFDAVIGNPPWGARFDPDERCDLARRFPGSTRGSFDSFKLFLDLASTLTRGTLGLVVPRAVLTQTRHADVRQVLMSRLDPYTIFEIDDGTFAGAIAPACALIFGSKPGPTFVQCASAPTRGARQPPVGDRSWVVAATWRSEGSFSLAPHHALDLLHRLRTAHPVLADVTEHFRLRDVGINYNRASVADRVLYSAAHPQDPRDSARYRGRDFSRYAPVSGGGWLRHNAAELLQPGERLFLDWQTYLALEKIAFRQTADRLVATLDLSRMAMGRSVIAIVSRGEGSLRALLACLNARLLTVLYRVLSGEEGRVLPQVKVARMLELPVPGICCASIPVDLQRRAKRMIRSASRDDLIQESEYDPFLAWALLDALVDRMLDRKGRDVQLDGLIDEIVCGLYGLTDAEKALLHAMYRMETPSQDSVSPSASSATGTRLAQLPR